MLLSERCAYRVDAVFVLDSSANVGDRNFQIIREFLKDLIREFEIGPMAAQVRQEVKSRLFSYLDKVSYWCGAIYFL